MSDSNRKTSPEAPQSRPKPCECRCGYTCGGPGVCPVYLSEECLQEHFKVDCDHVWDGPTKSEETPEGGGWESATCSKCGAVQMFHDMWVGP